MPLGHSETTWHCFQRFSIDGEAGNRAIQPLWGYNAAEGCSGTWGFLLPGLWRVVNLILGQYGKLGMKTWLVTFSDSGTYLRFI